MMRSVFSLKRNELVCDKTIQRQKNIDNNLLVLYDKRHSSIDGRINVKKQNNIRTRTTSVNSTVNPHDSIEHIKRIEPQRNSSFTRIKLIKLNKPAANMSYWKRPPALKLPESASTAIADSLCSEHLLESPSKYSRLKPPAKYKPEVKIRVRPEGFLQKRDEGKSGQYLPVSSSTTGQKVLYWRGRYGSLSIRRE